jgi:hypothetical protein
VRLAKDRVAAFEVPQAGGKSRVLLLRVEVTPLGK